MTSPEPRQRTACARSDALIHPRKYQESPFSWGEKDRLIKRFAATVKQLLPQIAESPSSIPNGDGDIASQLERLVIMRDGGGLSEDEFIAAKAKLLGGS